MTFWRRLLTLAFPPKTAASAADDTIASIFRAWAKASGLRTVERRDGRWLRFVGRLAGRDVVVDPGVDGPVPQWVHVTIAAALPAVRPLLVTRATRPSDAASTRVRALFDDADLGPELRSVSVSASQLDVRLAPGASPALVELASRRVADALRQLYAEPEPRTDSASSSPASGQTRHSCVTTVPYPS